MPSMEESTRLEKLEKAVEELKKELYLLRRYVGALHSGKYPSPIPLLQHLAQRGLTILQHDRNTQLLLPHSALEKQEDEFFELLRRYSFRLFLRDLIRYPEGRGVKALCRYCSPATARKYLKRLSALKIVTYDPRKGYRLLINGVASFGPTLEWYVGQIFARCFSAPVITSVKFKDTTTGGDYDVIALLEQRLVYVEVKSSPPRGVEKPAVRAFIDRLYDLQPDVALFFVDTELRMKDKMVVLFAEEMERRFGREARKKWKVKRLINELFHVNHGIYIVNSKKGVVANFRRCLSDFRRHRKLNRVMVPWSC